MQQMARAWELDAWEWMCEVECRRGLGRGKRMRESGCARVGVWDGVWDGVQVKSGTWEVNAWWS